jgi:hypothetical protein
MYLLLAIFVVAPSILIDNKEKYANLSRITCQSKK